VFDMRNVGYKHLLRPSVEGLKYFFRYLQDALPARLESMHIVNCVSFFDIVLTMIKPFTSSEILNKVNTVRNSAASTNIDLLLLLDPSSSTGHGFRKIPQGMDSPIMPSI
jgi:CRAL/TRIO domain